MGYFIMKNKLYFTLSLVLIFVVILSSIKTTLDSYHSYYKDSKKSQFSFICDKMYHYKPLRIFTSYTGFETGYGFFGTNVSSDFAISYELYDSAQTKIARHNFKLNSNEGSLRFMSMNRLFLDRLTKSKDDELFKKYIKIVMTEISKYIYTKYNGKYSVNLKVYLYNFPSLKDYVIGKSQTELFLLDEMNYKR